MFFTRILFYSILASLIPIILVVIEYSNHPDKTTIAVGGELGAYYQQALKFKEELLKDGVEVEIITTKGSGDIQEKLVSGEVEFGFVQGGTEINSSVIKGLANVAVEAIWIFHNFKKQVSLKDILQSEISVGMKGSGIYPVSEKLIDLVGVSMGKNHYSMPNKIAMEKLVSGEINAMVYVANEKSGLVQRLSNDPNVKIFSIEGIDGYQNFFLNEGDPFLNLKIPKGSFNPSLLLPSEDISLLGKNTVLVTSIDDNKLTRLLLKASDKIYAQPGLFSKESSFPNNKSIKFDLHESSSEFFSLKETFLERNFDFWVAQTLNSVYGFVLAYMAPIITLLGFIMGIMLPIFMYVERKKIIRWFIAVNHIDSGIIGINKREGRAKIVKLEKLQTIIRNDVNIHPSHMDEYYSLQAHIVSVIKQIKIEIKE